MPNVGKDSQKRNLFNSLLQMSDVQLIAIDILSSKHQQEWERFLSTCRESTFFHTFHSKELLKFGGGHQLYWGLWVNDALEAIWPTSLLPSFGGTVLRIIRPPAATERVGRQLLCKMLTHISESTRKKNALRWSADVPEGSQFVQFASHCGFEIGACPYYSYAVNTGLDTSVLWNRLAGEARTAVRKAGKQGLEVGEPRGPDDLSTFFSIYRSTMERRHLTNYFPLSSSLLPLLSLMIRKQEVKVFTASDRNRIVAGILLLLHKNNALWWIGGSLQDSWKMRPNEMLIWHAIEWASNSGFSELELGWAPTEMPGLQLFKRHLGAQRVNLVHLTLPINPLRDLLTTALVRTGNEMRRRGIIPRRLLALASRNRWF
jgi:hypothetical protein